MITGTTQPAAPAGTEQHAGETPQRFADLLARFVPGLDRDKAEAYVQKRIAFKVDRILQKFGLDESERDDLTQDLLMALVQGVPRYDKKRTRWKTFLSRILDRRYRHILRRLLRPGNDPATRPVGFDDIAEGFDETIIDPATTGEPFAAEDLRMDVEAVICAMPERLQVVCRLLTVHSPSGAARLMGVSPATITRAIHRIRPYFKRAGLEIFQNRPKRIRPSRKCRELDHRSELGDETVTEQFIDVSVLTCEAEDEYHGKAKQYLSSHQLLDFMRCPWLHRKKALGLIEDKDSPAYAIGRAAHVKILQGHDAYEAAYAIGGPVNPKTNRPFGPNTKAYREWADAQGKAVLTHEQAALVQNMATGVSMNAEAVDLLLYGRSEGVVRAEYCGVPCQIRLDWAHPHRGIVDLKTCDDLTWFESDARRFGYHRQMAFYRAVLAVVIGALMPVHLIGVEKKEPFRCGVWRLGDDTLAIAQQENEAAIRRLLRCRDLGDWPTGYEEIRMLNVA